MAARTFRVAPLVAGAIAALLLASPAADAADCDSCVNEAAVLRSTAGIASRDGRVLRIKSSGGRVVTFENSPDDCVPSEEDQVACPAFRLQAWSKPAGLLLVTGNEELPSFQLISAVTGDVVHSGTGQVLFAPDRIHAAVFFSSSELRAYQLEILKFAAGKATSEFTHDSSAESSGDGRVMVAALRGWKSDARLDFTITRDDEAQTKVAASAVRTAKGWRIRRR